MATKNDPITIHCKLEQFEHIHRAVFAAARRANQAGDKDLVLTLSNVLHTLGCADGLEAGVISSFRLWDVD